MTQIAINLLLNWQKVKNDLVPLTRAMASHTLASIAVDLNHSAVTEVLPRLHTISPLIPTMIGWVALCPLVYCSRSFIITYGACLISKAHPCWACGVRQVKKIVPVLQEQLL